MPFTPKAHVYIFRTTEVSRITTTYIGDKCQIKVFINPADSAAQSRRLLPEFASSIANKHILSFESSEVSMYIDNMFRFICRQLSNGVDLANVVDVEGNLLFVEPSDTPTSPLPGFPQAIASVFNAIENNEVVRNNIQTLVSNLGGSLSLLSPNSQTPPDPQFINVLNMVGRAVYQQVHGDIPSVPAVPSTQSPLIEPKFVENRQNATREIRINPENTYNETHLLTRIHKNSVDARKIASIATCIKQKIAANVTKPPSFTKLSTANYRRIKNYVHHHAKVWLSKKEILLFISEMNNNTQLPANSNDINALD